MIHVDVRNFDTLVNVINEYLNKKIIIIIIYKFSIIANSRMRECNFNDYICLADNTILEVSKQLLYTTCECNLPSCIERDIAVVSDRKDL